MTLKRPACGYSLLQLLITLGVVTMLIAGGIPSFGKIVANHRLRVEVDALFHAIHLARKESVVRRLPVTLCPTRDGIACEMHYDWSDGWMMFVNADWDRPAQRDSNEPLLQHFATNTANRIGANHRSFSLRSTMLRATNGTFVFCDRARRATPRALIVSYTGRPRVSLTDSRGNALVCPN